MRRKMIPPLPATFGESQSDRFKRFASAILSVPQSEDRDPEQAIVRLEAEKRKLERKTAEVRRVATKRKSAGQKQPT